MFESLSDKLESAFKKLRGHGRLTEGNIEEGLKDVRMALLEADVHYRVVKGFIEEVRSRSLGQEVMGSLTPGQQIVKIVYEKLTELMGSRHEGLALGGPPPAAIMLVGLQGSGKTTTAGKLAIQLRKSGRRPFLVPADVYRPAAIDQLKKIADQVDVPVFAST
ncbi:MAG TPA: signal recognition particle receptor subunit alpha, partial [Desulfobacterales bacterium]|nr:signal recognition particle receptor subunit alpha [Desulfobacterales bacterium]